MKIPSIALMLTVVILAGCEKPKPEPKLEVKLVDLRVIEASLEERIQWVREQKKLNRANFDASYSWLLTAKQIGEKEAEQFAYLFFYSSGAMCGSIDAGVLVSGVWKFDFHPGFPPSQGFPIFVNPRTKQVWQKGQREKIDAFALIKYE